MALYFPAPEWTGTYIDMAKFGYGRRKGRIHGACDLYAPLESDVKAITDGIVIEISSIYEAKTQAIAIRHEGIGIVRYGEIVKIPKEIFKETAKVKAGDVIGKVGQVIKLSPMLHLELFDGTASGRLSDRSGNIEYYNEGVLKNGNYERRKDLMNPTKFLERLWLEGIK
jgi:murein DD-endopeptidase MepM/ murein hydrolase activator NlpD